MALSSRETMRLGRKLGFGLRPEEPIPDDFVGWAVGQLTAKPRHLGVASVRAADDAASPPPPIVEWPVERVWSLDQQIEHAMALRAGIEQLDKKFDRNDAQYGQQRAALEAEHFPNPWDMVRRIHQAVYGEAPILERFAHFWANHFTTAYKDACGNVFGHYLGPAIRDRLDGDFATMLYGVTIHPSMQNYLDNCHSVGPNSQDGKGLRADGIFADINENLARELLELHTVSPSAGYTQDDIIAAANILTGWGYIIDHPDTRFPSEERWEVFNRRRHEPGEKTVMGQTYANGAEALRQLTDFLAVHDHTAQFLSLKLARYFLSDTPDAADVDAIATVWRESAGNLPAVHRRVIEIAAARPDYRKFQQPEIWLYQALRVSGGDLFNGFEQVGATGPSMDAYRRDGDILRELGQTYWIERQPNGYSDLMADWISPEHMDRRLRFSRLIQQAAHPRLSADEIAARLGLGETTLALIAKGKDEGEKFMLLFCSPELTEA